MKNIQKVIEEIKKDKLTAIVSIIIVAIVIIGLYLDTKI
jgi:hypothetical protein